MILSKLAPQSAANVLLTLDKPLRSEIIKRMISISTIPETATRIVENQLRARVLTATSVKDTSAGQTRVASVLNETRQDAARRGDAGSRRMPARPIWRRCARGCSPSRTSCS